MIELLPFGDRIRRGGQLVVPERGEKLRRIDFGQGPVEAARFTWGDVFTAHHSTGIPDIEVYVALPPAMRRQMAMVRALRPCSVSRRCGPDATRRAAGAERRCAGKNRDACLGSGPRCGRTHGGVRLHGPEAGLVWTTRTALAAAKRVLAGKVVPGYQTPAKAFGPDFVSRRGRDARRRRLAPVHRASHCQRGVGVSKVQAVLFTLLGLGRAARSSTRRCSCSPCRDWPRTPSGCRTSASRKRTSTVPRRRHGDRGGIERALGEGARVTDVSPVDGKTALFRAAVFGHADAVRLLLEQVRTGRRAAMTDARSGRS
jgi:hypothetical protein